MLTENAKRLLEARYFKEGENWMSLCDRVSSAVARTTRQAEEFYDMLYHMDFLPNSPCLMGAGTPLQQLAACFVLPVEDSMEGIFDAIKEAALIHKSGGGTGFSFSNLRAQNQPVSSTKGVASGPVSFMKVFNSATEQVKQGGRRKGANMAVMRADHPDIYRFLDAKWCEGDLSNFNLTVAIPPGMMHQDFTELRDPSSGQVVEVKPTREILGRIARTAHRNGEPGIIFLDTINDNRPAGQLEWMEACNPCGEFPGIPYEPCMLGSMNLNQFLLHDNTVDTARLEEKAQSATQFLDCMIDANNYPLPQVDRVAKQNRKIGLGVMGLHDMLMRARLPYASAKGRIYASSIMEKIQQASHEESLRLGQTLGKAPNALADAPYRNLTTTAIAPTGSLSLIANCSTGIEPCFGLSQERTILDGQTYTEHCEAFAEALQEDCVSSKEELPEPMQRVFDTATEIDGGQHVLMQAAIQNHVDNGVSKTINLPNKAGEAEVERTITLAWRTGCKGLTIYRDGSRDEQVICSLCS